MFALALEYVNHGGDEVSQWLPIFHSIAECEWWRDWFIEMLTADHAAYIKASCEAL